MNWTRRMTEVAEIDAAWLAQHGRAPTLAAVGRLLGVSRETIRRHRWRIERWQKIPRQSDEHVKRWRKLFMEAIEALQRAAKRSAFTVTTPKPRKRQQEIEHVMDWWREQARQRAASLAAEWAARQAERRQRAEAIRQELQRALAADPRLRELDRIVRQQVRKGG